MARHTRRLIIWIFGGILALVLLAALAVVAMVWLVDPNVYRSRIASAATNSLGRPVTLGGDLRWNIGRDIGISSAGGSIGNAPGFGTTPFASWRSLRIGLDARALMQQRIVVDQLELDGLELNLQRNAAGQGNWVFALAQAEGGREGKAQFQLASIRLRNSRLSFSDASDVTATDTPAIWRLDDVSLDAALPADLKAVQRELGDVDLSGRLAGGPLPASGVPVAFNAASVRHDSAAATLDVPEFQARWMNAELSGNVRAALGDPVSAQGKVTLRVPSVRELLASLDVTLPPMSDPDTLGRLEMESAFELKDDALIASGLQAKLDDTAMSGTVSVAGFSPLALRFDLAGDAIDLDRYMEPADYQGKPLELPLAQLKQFDAQGVLRLKSAKVAGAMAEELRIDVE